MSKFFEALKAVFGDVEIFLSTTLKDVKLPKAAVAEKENILKKLVDLQDEFPQLKTSPSQSEPLLLPPPPPSIPANRSDELPPEPRKKTNNAPELQNHSEDNQEIYSAIGEEAEQEQDPYKCSSSISDGSSEQSSVFLSASEAMANCSMSGMLVKKNVAKSKVDVMALFRGKKFCVVASGVFYIFDKPGSKKQCGSFPLRGYEARMSADQSSKKEFLFELVNPGQKTYVFAAGTQEDMQQWISILAAEALRIPDPRASLVYEPSIINGDNDSNSDEDYEEPDDSSKTTTVVTKVRTLPAQKDKKQLEKTATAVVALKEEKLPPSNAIDDEELYDDVALSKDDDMGAAANEDDEIYADADNKHDPDTDELIYECFDEVSLPPPPAALLMHIPEAPLSSTATTTAHEKSVDAMMSADGSDDYENMFYGKWNCKPDGDNELEFKHGDMILIVSREYGHFGWWVGRLGTKVGLVPREYLTPAYELVSG